MPFVFGTKSQPFGSKRHPIGTSPKLPRPFCTTNVTNNPAMEQLTIRLTLRQMEALEKILRVLSAAYTETLLEPDAFYTGADLDEFEAVVAHLRRQLPAAIPDLPPRTGRPPFRHGSSAR